DSPHSGLLDIVRRGEIRFSGAEVHNVDALRPQFPASADTFMVEETLIVEIRSAISVLSSGDMFSYGKRVWPPAPAVLKRLRSRISTDAGTRPEIFPPSPITSFTSRELMNEWA